MWSHGDLTHGGTSLSWPPWAAHFELLINIITHKANCIPSCRCIGAVSHTTNTLGMAWCIQTPLLESLCNARSPFIHFHKSHMFNSVHLDWGAVEIGVMRRLWFTRCLVEGSERALEEVLGLAIVWLIINHPVSYKVWAAVIRERLVRGSEGWQPHNEWRHTGVMVTTAAHTVTKEGLTFSFLP